jgi:hypothetical protein
VRVVIGGAGLWPLAVEGRVGGGGWLGLCILVRKTLAIGAHPPTRGGRWENPWENPCVCAVYVPQGVHQGIAVKASGFTRD